MFIELLKKPFPFKWVFWIGMLLNLCILIPSLGAEPKDFDGYWRDAKALVEFGTFGNPSGYSILPGYSFVLAIFAKVVSYKYVLLTNLFLLLFGSVYFFRFLRDLLIPENIFSALVILALWFVNPFHIYVRTKLLSENLFVPAIIAFFYYFYIFLKSGGVRNPIWAGFFLAMATYARPVSLYLIFFMIPAVFYFRRSWLQYVLTPLVLFLLLLPWGLRNYFVFDSFTLTTSQVAESFLGCNNTFLLHERDDLRGNWMGLGDTLKLTKDEKFKENLQKWFDLHQAHRLEEAEELAKIQVRDFWLEHFWEMPGFALSKLKWFWHYSGRHPLNRTWYYDLIGVFFYLLWLPWVGLFVIKNRKHPLTAIFILAAIYFSSITILTFGSVRLRMPLEFFFALLSIKYLWECFFVTKILYPQQNQNVAEGVKA